MVSPKPSPLPSPCRGRGKDTFRVCVRIHSRMTVPQKPAPADHPILEAIRERWSPLAFDSRAIEEEKVQTLFEAARWAPSSFNEQPWRYIYAQKGDTGRDALENLLVSGNAWAKNAGLLLISFARRTFTKNAKENRHHLHDVGAASSFIALQLVELGLIGHQMEGFDRANANRILGVPDEYVPGSMMAIGYPADPSALPPDLQERQARERVRRPIAEFAFKGRWLE